MLLCCFYCHYIAVVVVVVDGMCYGIDSFFSYIFFFVSDAGSNVCPAMALCVCVYGSLEKKLA